jgi:hypothetical protein
MGYLITSQRDRAGRSNSVFFAATAEGQKVKETFGSKVDAQITQLEALFTMQEVDTRNVDRELNKLVNSFARTPAEKNVKDTDQRVLNAVLQYDLGAFSSIQSLFLCS